MAWLTDVMRQGMDFFFGATGSYGVAIILLTVVIRIVLLPFTFTEVRTRLKMQAIQPEVKALQEKYKKEPERLNKEMMALWRKHGVNPLSGCLPMLLQFPFIIAFFGLLQGYEYSGQAGFLWIADLSSPDRLYILPVLAAVTTWLQTSMTGGLGADQTQKTMTIAMPLLIGWFATRFPAGLSLYWVVTNVLSIAQQYVTTFRAAPRKGDEGKSDEADR